MDSTMFIGIITLIATLVIDIINRIKAVKDNEPQLSFELKNFNGELYLKIKNTGKTKATNINVNIIKIRNNGKENLMEDLIFSIPFELNSEEYIQGFIANYGENITTHTFPFIDIGVSYKKSHFIKKVKYKRQVFFYPNKDIENLFEIKSNICSINKQIDELRRPILRIANYFDGNQISTTDEGRNIITSQTFEMDLYDAIINKKRHKGEYNSKEH